MHSAGCNPRRAATRQKAAFHLPVRLSSPEWKRTCRHKHGIQWHCLRGYISRPFFSCQIVLQNVRISLFALKAPLWNVSKYSRLFFFIYLFIYVLFLCQPVDGALCLVTIVTALQNLCHIWCGSFAGRAFALSATVCWNMFYLDVVSITSTLPPPRPLEHSCDLRFRYVRDATHQLDA